GVLGQGDRARLGDAFEAGGDIDAVAHQVAVGFLDDVAEMDADAKLDAPLGRKAGVTLDEAVLQLDPAAHGVDDAAELDQDPVAGALDHPAVVDGDHRIDEVAAERPQPGENAVLVGAGKPREADDVGNQNCRQLAHHDHGPASAYPGRI